VSRRATARRLTLSAQTVAPVTLHRRFDAAAAVAALGALRASRLPATFTHLVLWATARALRAHPSLNAVWDGERLLRARRVDLGVAVDVDGDLLVGVIAGADALSLPDLVAAGADVFARVRARETSPDDAAGTFTVTNLGMFGVEGFTPIINPPQVAVLGVGALADELVLELDGLRRRPRCPLSLTFDHRAVDGAPAARFLQDVCGALEGLDRA
jgi:pyruvate/2-oxoglutarate dehydrogenase complex dihydrolipoamide acyltransferase (E2) component